MRRRATRRNAITLTINSKNEDRICRTLSELDYNANQFAKRNEYKRSINTIVIRGSEGDQITHSSYTHLLGRTCTEHGVDRLEIAHRDLAATDLKPLFRAARCIEIIRLNGTEYHQRKQKVALPASRSKSMRLKHLIFGTPTIKVIEPVAEATTFDKGAAEEKDEAKLTPNPLAA